MSEKIWTRVIRPGSGGHAQMQVVQLRKGAEVLDALMDPSGAVVLTYKGKATDSIEDRVVYVLESGCVISGGEFVSTVRHPGPGDLFHVFVAEAGARTT
jgi:hypothetical protein